MPRPGDLTMIQVGTKCVSGSGVEMRITNIQIGNVHLRQPSIWVTYEYNDNGRIGSDHVSFDNFYENFCS